METKVPAVRVGGLVAGFEVVRPDILGGLERGVDVGAGFFGSALVDQHGQEVGILARVKTRTSLGIVKGGSFGYRAERGGGDGGDDALDRGFDTGGGIQIVGYRTGVEGSRCGGSEEGRAEKEADEKTCG